MSQPQQPDPWDLILQQVGAVPPSQPPQQQQAPAAEPAEQAKQQQESPSCQVPTSVPEAGEAKHEAPTGQNAPQTAEAKASQRRRSRETKSNWASLARELGIAVPEEEPEVEPPAASVTEAPPEEETEEAKPAETIEQETVAAETTSPVETAEGEESTRQRSRRGRGRRGRGRRRGRRSDGGQEETAQAPLEEPQTAEAPATTQRRKGRTAGEGEEDKVAEEPESQEAVVTVAGEEEKQDKPAAKRARNIPSWEEAVGLIIQWNLEHRTPQRSGRSRRR